MRREGLKGAVMQAGSERTAGVSSPGCVVAVAQAAAVVGDVEANLATLERLVARAVRHGADVVVTPELFVTGYDPVGARGHDGERLRERIAEAAVRHRIAVVASTIETEPESDRRERATGGSCHRIVASFIDADGEERARSRKAHLYGADEQDFLCPGEYGQVFEWGGLHCALGTCYDVEFPEFVRHGARAGAELFLVPTAVPTHRFQDPERDAAWSYDAVQTSLLQVPARALENGVAIAYANHAGEGFTAHSCIATPYGRHAVLLDSGEGVAAARVTAEAVSTARRVNTYLEDLGRGSCA